MIPLRDLILIAETFSLHVLIIYMRYQKSFILIVGSVFVWVFI